ncbi:MAG: SMC-Scp complex subunit ScpB, partial [Patescibacteria group bacterium]|nr:SMC-Scp complex subunit ScpB [Patescibacteria group bacterium]
MTSENNQNKNKIAELEVLLFVYGEPISISNIAKYLNLNEEDCLNLIKEYELKLKEENRGLAILINNNLIQLGTKPEYSDLVENLVKREFSDDLTPAASETLSIILYLGPISKSKIDYLRGVDSGFILRNLMIRGLIERFQNPYNLHTFLYDVSFKLLKYLGINKKEDLPDYEKFKKLNEKFEENNQENKQINQINLAENKIEHNFQN